MELNEVPAAKLLVFVSWAARLGKTRLSPATGAVPPQLAAVAQLASRPAPDQRHVASSMRCSNSSTRSRARWADNDRRVCLAAFLEKSSFPHLNIMTPK